MAIAFTTETGPSCHAEAVPVDPGMAYRRWNAGDDEARWLEVSCAG
jgi:hypothetical protein